jgi:predicted  nucleic acid-binding Zn-ribbon protein
LKDKICLLIQLQHCDNRIREIRKRKEEGPLKIKMAEDDLRYAETETEEERSRLDGLKKERRKIEQEVQELDGKIEKSSVKLSQIKSNKEYTAALKEIDDLKKAKFITEDKIIAVMEKIDGTEQGAAQQDSRLEELRVEIEKNKQQILAEIADLDKELAALGEKRQALINEMDADLLKKYLFLQERKNGLAVSAVVTGVCQTCHMGIPPQKFNELIRGNALMTCPHCNRIMYWGDDEDFQKVKAML